MKTSKKLSIFLALVMVFALLPTVTLANNNVTVTIEGQTVVFADQGPVIVDGRTLVPVAGVFQALEFITQWDPNTRQVTITGDGSTIILTIGSRNCTTNDVTHTLDVPAQIIGGRTMLPIAIVLRSVGYEVNWNSTTRTVAITSGGQAAPPVSHPFASALSDFFADVTQAPEWAVLPEATHAMSQSAHAILVDVDGNGTQGMLASKWTTDVQRYLPQSSAESIFVQRLFLISGNEARPTQLYDTAITPAKRLITINGASGQGAEMRAYTLLGFTNGQLTPIKSIMITQYGQWRAQLTGEGNENFMLYYNVWESSGEANSYAINYHTSEFWNRNAEQDQVLTHAEFNGLMTQYRLNGVTAAWELPDETSTILVMSAN